MTRSTRAELVGRSEQDDYQRFGPTSFRVERRMTSRGSVTPGAVGCSQGSSADAIRYPRGMEQSG